MMRLLFIILILASLVQAGCKEKTSAEVTLQRVECKELGIYFMLPSSFKYVNEERMDELAQRGNKAFKEESIENKKLGWQNPCPSLQDSLKRTIFITSITEKEAEESDGSADAFIDKTFADYNKFITLRLETKLDVKTSDEFWDGVWTSQKKMTIAGYDVKANFFDLEFKKQVMFMSRSYFFRQNGNLYMITFTGSPKASDNDTIVHAIEKAERMDAENAK